MNISFTSTLIYLWQIQVIYSSCFCSQLRAWTCISRLCLHFFTCSCFVFQINCHSLFSDNHSIHFCCNLIMYLWYTINSLYMHMYISLYVISILIFQLNQCLVIALSFSIAIFPPVMEMELRACIWVWQSTKQHLSWEKKR